VQDEHGLVVDGPGEFHFALDVEQPFGARDGAGGHAHGQAEAVVAQVDDAQAVELAHARAAERDEAVAFQNGFTQALVGVVVAVVARGQGGFHVLPLDQAGATRLGGGGAFHHQGLGAGEGGALAGLVLGLAVGVFDQPRHGGGAEVRQAQAGAGVPDEHAGGVAGVVAGVEGVGKVHLHAEVAGKFGVALLQGIEMLVGADEHDLHIHVHGFGFQRGGGQGGEHGAGLFDLQAAAAQEAAQLFPDQLVGEQVAHVQHQVAAMGLEQAARADAREVGDEHVVFRLVFDAAEEWAVQRVVLDDNGCALGVGVVHHQVDAVARELAGERFAAFLVVLGGGDFEQDHRLPIERLRLPRHTGG